MLVPFLSLVDYHHHYHHWLPKIHHIHLIITVIIIMHNAHPRYLISTICGSSCPPSPDVVIDILFWIGECVSNNVDMIDFQSLCN